jgi:hypothetical protein
MDKKKSLKKRGGQRPGAGRKKTEEPTEPITIYVKKNSIQHHGGKNALKLILTKVAESNVIIEAPAVDALLGKTKKIHKEPPPDQFKDKAILPGGIIALSNEEIRKKIAEIRVEKIPEARNTALGKRAWDMDRQKKIAELEKQLQ